VRRTLVGRVLQRPVAERRARRLESARASAAACRCARVLPCSMACTEIAAATRAKRAKSFMLTEVQNERREVTSEGKEQGWRGHQAVRGQA
jgi:hypothetical protein